MIKKVKCPFCSSDESSILYEFDKGIAISRCGNCSFAYTSPRLDAAEREKMYGEEYFSGGSETGMFMDYLANSAVFENDAAERCRLLKKYVKTGKILEIGSAGGFFLKECMDNGFQSCGVEYSHEMCEYAATHFKANIFCGDLSDASFEDGSFDAVALWHVLEHFENPADTLQIIHRKLKNSGYIFISVPDFSSVKDAESGYRLLQPYVHLSHFSRSTLEMLLEDKGFEIVKIFSDGGTGLLGHNSAIPGGLRNFIATNIRKLEVIRKIIKFLLFKCLKRKDFITAIGRKK